MAGIAGNPSDDHTRVSGNMGETLPHNSEDHNSAGTTMVGPPDDDADKKSAYFNGMESPD